MGKFIKKEPKVKLEHTDTKQPNTKLPPSKVKFEEPQPKQEKIKEENQEKGNENPEKKKTFKHARFIIRNLVFDISEKHIRKLIAPFGTIRQINMPRHPDKNTNKGFAFVEMENKIECLKAIKQLNGSSYKGRTIVLDMSVSKENFMTEKLKQSEKQDKMKDEKEEEVNENDEIKDEGQEDSVKDQNQQVEEKQEDDQEQNADSDDEQDQSKENLRIMKEKEDHLLEIFIRNIPISVTEKDLFKHFSKHGQISIVKVVKNKQTGLSKGTAFIKFNDPEVAQKLIEYSRSYEMYLMKKIKHFVPDPSIKLQIDGMIMKIFPVESRQEIQDKLKERDGQNKTEKTKKPVKKIKKLEDLVKTDIHGKRKLVLSLIGRWRAEEGMHKNDYEMFKNHEKEKVQKLKNPNQSVSSTRVILKHLDKTITEQQIRGFCNSFLSERNLGGNNLTYCKLMLEKDMKKSAGFAFVEFKKHESARQFIELLAKSPKLLQKQLFVVEFAIQDSRKMLKLKKRSEKEGPQQKERKAKDPTKQFQKYKQIKKQRTNKNSKIQRRPRK